MELITKAVIFAARAHDGMYRKGGLSPYILHPLEAAAIVGSMTNDQQIIAAAVLHDVVEDTPVTREEILEQFGPRVAELVMSETEDKYEDLPPEQTWLLRKQEAVQKLEQTEDPAVKMLYIGDKLSNLRTIAQDLKELGPTIWQRFHQQDPDLHRWYYTSIARATRELEHTQAWQEYAGLTETVFK